MKGLMVQSTLAVLYIVQNVNMTSFGAGTVERIVETIPDIAVATADCL